MSILKRSFDNCSSWTNCFALLFQLFLLQALNSLYFHENIHSQFNRLTACKMSYWTNVVSSRGNGTQNTPKNNRPNVSRLFHGEFQVKKRAQYENEIIKCESGLEAIPIAYGDRFIPRRYFRKVAPTISTKSIDENENDIFCVKKQPFYWRMHNYRISVGIQLGLNDNGRLLNFHDFTTLQSCERSFNKNPMKTDFIVPSKSTEELDWPCKPRAKPLSYNDSTHDMPGFDDYHNGNNIIDWSSQGLLKKIWKFYILNWSFFFKFDIVFSNLTFVWNSKCFFQWWAN